MIASRHYVDYKGIDVFKFIMAFSVIAIHAPEYLWPNDIMYPPVFEWFIRLAVPYFFIASGFLIQEKLNETICSDNSTNILKEKSRRVFRIWGLWLLLYLPLTVWGEFHSIMPIYNIVIQYIKNVIFTGHSLYAQPLWFIYSMGIVLFIWSLIGEKRYLSRLVVLFCMFFTCTIVAYIIPMNSSISVLGYVKSVCVWSMGGGLPMLGGAIYNIVIHKYNGPTQYYILFCCLTLSIILFCFKLPLYPFFGGMSLFILSIVIGMKLKRNYRCLRDQSMWLYYTHMYIIMTCMVLIRQLNITGNRWCLLTVACIASWSLACLLNKLSESPKFSKLKTLIK